MRRFPTTVLTATLTLSFATAALAQSVCLPLPRLLTTKPMGGQVGTTLDITITGENMEDVEQLRFSHPGITAKQMLNADGIPVANQYVVTIAEDCPLGIHEARVMTRLGVSSSRVFNVNDLPEITVTTKNTTLEQAVELQLNSICNAAMTRQAIDHYKFQAEKDQRVLVDCAAKGIDSKLTPVVIVADEKGQDLIVERRGGVIDFTVPETGTYVIKVHDLTFDGSAYHFYRLALKTLNDGDTMQRLASTRDVNAFSWPPAGLTDANIAPEAEPNDDQPQKITLPCDITGSFAKAADTDLFEFEGKKGDVWWIEVASERLGRPTDPSIVVQRVTQENGEEKLTDVAELSDISSPVKISSNHYSYDGPPYNAGSTDILGKFEIKEDGLHRIQLWDLFGGTRTDPNNIYRMIVRKAQPDFALVSWAMHMNLRNGDRNALSKPMALRGGITMPFEVVVVRRDGFDGEIELFMDDLPEGVSAAGLKIPAGQSQGMMLVTAEENAARTLKSVKFFGRAVINGETVERPCYLASMAWPVTNHWSEIPSPRLLADVPVSVSGSERAPITIAAEDKVFEVTEGESLTIPLQHTLRSEFSGSKISFKTMGVGFDKTPAFDVALDGKDSQAVLDTAKLKTAPGDYVVAFYGSAVAKYRYNPEAVTVAENVLKQAKEEAAASAEEAKRLAADAKTATGDDQKTVEQAAKEAAEKQKAAEAAVAAAEKQLNAVTAQAKPKDISDIVTTEPIRIRVTAKQK